MTNIDKIDKMNHQFPASSNNVSVSNTTKQSVNRSMSELDPLLIQSDINNQIKVHKKHSKEYEMKKMQKKQNIKRFQ